MTICHQCGCEIADAALSAALPILRDELAKEIEARANVASKAALLPRARSPYRHEADVMREDARIVRGEA